jgi:SAM-dependent methyltransferase
LQHQIWLKTLDERLFSVPHFPPEESKRLEPLLILDIGTGAGSWALDVAKKYPETHVFAIDITLPKLEPALVPENITFLKADAEGPWEFAESRSFDYIHARMLGSGIHDWPALLATCWQHLKPGGWLELGDAELPFRCSSVSVGAETDTLPLIKFGQWADKAWSSHGLDYRAAAKHVVRLEELGFKDISQRTVQWPIGPWLPDTKMREAGEMVLEDVLALVSTAGIKILTSGIAHDGYRPLSEEEAQDIVREALIDVERNWQIRKYWTCM